MLTTFCWRGYNAKLLSIKKYMARTTNIWLLVIYYDVDKTQFYKKIECDTLLEIAYLLNKKIYDVSNVYHKITKPKGIFLHISIYKTL